jgi:DNA-directed RNA polymerase subunit M/transcription elongation factor TFIIS
MHTQPMSETEGDFADWKPTEPENHDFKCCDCDSDEVYYRIWESDCGGYEDVQYHCRGCGRKWWVEGPDA